MTTNKPEVVAYHHINKENPEHRAVSLHHDASCTSTLINTEPLIRLSDYEALQVERDHYKNVIKEVTTRNLVERWSKTAADKELEQYLSSGISQLENEHRKQIEALRAECEKLRTCLAETAGVAVTMLYESHRQDTIKEFGVTELTMMVDCTKHLAGANVQVEKVYRKAWSMAQGCAGADWGGAQ